MRRIEEDYCETCLREQSTTKRKVFIITYQNVESCTQWVCGIATCETCRTDTCDDCLEVCTECEIAVCPNCSASCPIVKSQEKAPECYECHFKECGQCWKPEQFPHLPKTLKKSIVTMLLVFKRVSDVLCIPPKYVKYQIFRELITNKVRPTLTPIIEPDEEVKTLDVIHYKFHPNSFASTDKKYDHYH